MLEKEDRNNPRRDNSKKSQPAQASDPAVSDQFSQESGPQHSKLDPETSNKSLSLLSILNRPLKPHGPKLFKWEKWYKPKAFELKDNCKFYRRLGVKFFKFIMPTSGDWIIRKQKKMGFRPDAFIGGSIHNKSLDKSIDNYIGSTKMHEEIHVFGAVAMAALSVADLALSGGVVSATCIGVTNLLVNIYPIGVQRFNRARLVNFKNKREALRKAKSKS